ncbi:uncharacterized protein LOC141849307 [Brevipalpus obovatus]|uniref:uncharacterized protein LOC141849307 n=1 Tax=Brevipalpus obovatus TaxID=246614 RepID=UPI003D9E6947
MSFTPYFPRKVESWLLLIFTVTFMINKTQSNLEKLWNYGIGGPERAASINPQIVFPCLKAICDPELDCFEPIVFFIYVTFPPISACPEVINMKTVRFPVISAEDSSRFMTVSEMKPGSSVALFYPGTGNEYDMQGYLIMAKAVLHKYDYFIILDWARLSFPRVISTLRLHTINVFLNFVNSIMVGRIGCKFVRFMAKTKKIEPQDVFILGFSAGSSALSSTADYCKLKYSIKFDHFMAIELPSIPFRRSNYKLVNHTHAKFVDMLFTTVVSPIALLDEIDSALGKVGYIEAIGDCVYLVNPKNINSFQPVCFPFQNTACSHGYAMFVFAAAYSDKCVYNYGPCPLLPPNLGISVPETGTTRLDCRDHPHLKRTCINVGPYPLISC